MSKVIPDIDKADEEEAVGGCSDTQDSPQKKTGRNFIFVLLLLVAIALIIGLSVGLTRKDDSTKTSTATNLEIFDSALKLIESTPRYEKELPSGETMSYREYNAGQPSGSHVLVLLPGYNCDDTLFSVSKKYLKHSSHQSALYWTYFNIASIPPIIHCIFSR